MILTVSNMHVPWMWALVAGLAGLAVYQQLRLIQVQRSARHREELFHIVADNAADMIALVDVKGRRLYNSPAYKRILGYSPAELSESSAFEQIHPDDRFRVLEAAREARGTGVGKKLEYRIRHKDGSWKVLESVASAIRDPQGHVCKLLIVNRDVTERKQTEDQRGEDAFRDGLTGLPNRRLFLDRLEHLFHRAQRDPNFHYAVLLVDIDHFKTLVERVGGLAADRCLRDAGQRIAASLRLTDTIARPEGGPPGSDAMVSRFSAQQFTVLLEETKDASDAMRIAQRIQEALARPVVLAAHGLMRPGEPKLGELKPGEPKPAEAGQEVRLSASVGIALSAPTHRQAGEILQETELATRRAQALGGARAELFDEASHSGAVQRLKLEAELGAAMGEHQFRMFYQPEVELATRRIVGLEALLRWQHPTQGLVSPYQFLDTAENLGLLAAIGQWTILESCKQMREWKRRNLGLELTVAVNLSARQLADPQLPEMVQTVLRETGLEAARLRLEVSESVANLDPRLAVAVLSKIRQLGVGITLDDFAAGPASLSLLRQLPVDALKIDRHLVHNLTSDRAAVDVMELALMMGLKLNLRVIAKGIESNRQLERLRTLGFELGQGFLFSYPVAADALEALIQSELTQSAAANGTPGSESPVAAW